MDMLVPLTLEATRLVLHMCVGSSSSDPEHLYNLFYKAQSCTYIYILSNGRYFFAKEYDLKGRQYALVTIEEAREMLFIRSLET